MKTYIPNPLDTEHIVLPEALNELTEQMARNVTKYGQKAALMKAGVTVSNVMISRRNILVW